MKNGLIINENGTRYWYQNGLRHREDGPAIEYTNGERRWYLNGFLHREDGPAIEYTNGDRYWYLNDKSYSFDIYLNKLYIKDCAKKTLLMLKWSSR